jgi:hypothetical protein
MEGRGEKLGGSRPPWLPAFSANAATGIAARVLRERGYRNCKRPPLRPLPKGGSVAAAARLAGPGFIVAWRASRHPWQVDCTHA